MSGPRKKARAPEVWQIITTVDTRTAAQGIARELVERRLAACVQVMGPIQSTYRWHGEVETEREWMCVVKTDKRCLSHVMDAVREAHPYDLPEIIAMPVVQGSREYFAWVLDQVVPPCRTSPAVDRRSGASGRTAMHRSRRGG